MRCGGGGNQGNKHTDNWAELCDRIIGSLQETLSTLYEGLEAGMFYASSLCNFVTIIDGTK